MRVCVHLFTQHNVIHNCEFPTTKVTSCVPARPAKQCEIPIARER